MKGYRDPHSRAVVCRNLYDVDRTMRTCTPTFLTVVKADQTFLVEPRKLMCGGTQVGRYYVENEQSQLVVIELFGKRFKRVTRLEPQKVLGDYVRAFED